MIPSRFLILWHAALLLGKSRRLYGLADSTRRGHRYFKSTAWTVHDRLRHSLQYHPDFQDMDLDRFVLSRRKQHRFDPTALGENPLMSSSTTKIARHTSAIGNNVDEDRSPPLTLQQARTVLQHAMDATFGVMKSHGHLPTTSRSQWDSGSSPESISGRRIRQSSRTPLTLSPLDYGADPSGKLDSTMAFANLMYDLLYASPRGRSMAANITNLGGVTLDLQGGQYLISAPIIIPPFFGNIHITDGSLQASTTPFFPQDRWLIEIGDDDQCRPLTPDGKDDPQKSCNEFIDVSNVLLDANFVAAGGIRVSKVMGTTLQEVFVTGFVTSGIHISNGHEVMISNAWLAECYWSTNAYCRKTNSTSVGIVVDGMDHYITNTIVFDYAKVGVMISKPATLLVGVHTWNGGGHGIDILTHSVRLIGCYLDFETLNLWNPRDILVESTFFYYGHTVLHASGPNSIVDGLIMRFNHYNTNQSVILDGSFDVVSSVSIQEEVDWVRTTRASRRLTQSGAMEWTFDFTAQLIFPTIDFVSYSVVSNNIHSGLSYMATQPNGTLVVNVVASEPVDATVYITVEQGGGRYDS